jgi:hypothetical protein
MLKRLIGIVGLVAALLGSMYLAKIATNGGMMDTLGWTTTGYAVYAD